MLKISAEDLKKVIETNAWDSELGILALRIERTMPSTKTVGYRDPKLHLQNWLNKGYIIEKAFLEAYPTLKWNNDTHEYLYEGLPEGAAQPDFKDARGFTVEAKCYRSENDFLGAFYGEEGHFAGAHGADIILGYIMTNKKTIVWDVKRHSWYDCVSKINPQFVYVKGDR